MLFPRERHSTDKRMPKSSPKLHRNSLLRTPGLVNILTSTLLNYLALASAWLTAELWTVSGVLDRCLTLDVYPKATCEIHRMCRTTISAYQRLVRALTEWCCCEQVDTCLTDCCQIAFMPDSAFQFHLSQLCTPLVMIEELCWSGETSYWTDARRRKGHPLVSDYMSSLVPRILARNVSPLIRPVPSHVSLTLKYTEFVRNKSNHNKT